MSYATITMASPVGVLTLLASERGLAAVLWGEETRVRIGPRRADPDNPVLAEARRQLDAYFSGQRTAFDLPLDPEGTPFQQRVWQALRDIPFGETRSYGAIARAIGQPNAVRAVGAANGRNPISIVVPCHRVIGSDGSMTGFGGGIANKRWLLAHEAAPSLL